MAKAKMVFISHSSEDKNFANAVCHSLESQGIRCWIAPRDVEFGDFAESIMNAIEKCRIMVVVITSNANASKYLTKEVNQAVNNGCIIIPVRFQDVAPSKGLQLYIGSSHWLDAFTPPMATHLDKLGAKIKTLLKNSDSDGENEKVVKETVVNLGPQAPPVVVEKELPVEEEVPVAPPKPITEEKKFSNEVYKPVPPGGNTGGANKPKAQSGGGDLKNYIIAAVVIVFGIGFIYYALTDDDGKKTASTTTQTADSNTDDNSSYFRTEASKMNRKCPLMTDEATRLDSVAFLPGNELSYYYTVINLEKASIDVEKFLSLVKPDVLASFKTSTDIQKYKEGKVTILHNFRDKYENVIGRVVITPSDYGE